MNIFPHNDLVLQVSETSEERRKEEHIQTTICHHALRNFLPLNFVIGSSFLNTIMYKTRLPRSASLSPSVLLKES